jgi:hypothetical protein
VSIDENLRIIRTTIAKSRFHLNRFDFCLIIFIRNVESKEIRKMRAAELIDLFKIKKIRF